jgi:hypothetical protein
MWRASISLRRSRSPRFSTYWTARSSENTPSRTSRSPVSISFAIATSSSRVRSGTPTHLLEVHADRVGRLTGCSLRRLLGFGCSSVHLRLLGLVRSSAGARSLRRPRTSDDPSAARSVCLTDRSGSSRGRRVADLAAVAGYRWQTAGWPAGAPRGRVAAGSAHLSHGLLHVSTFSGPTSPAEVPSRAHPGRRARILGSRPQPLAAYHLTGVVELS